jgi:hypothetical protein
MDCPVCKKEFDEHTGRRPKKFCSDNCKVKFWNVKKKVAENNKPENKKRILGERNATPITEKSIYQNPIADNSEKIKELEEEIKTLPDVGLGKKRRIFLEGKIRELKSQMK